MSSGSAIGTLSVAPAPDDGQRPLAPLDAQSRSNPQRFTNTDWLILAAICLSTIALFARTSRFDFIGYDDATYITHDPHIRGGLSWQNLRWMMVDSAGGNWCPLTLSVQLTLSTIFGLKAAAFHLTNVLFHTAAAGLLFVFLSRTTRHRWLAAAATGLWAWHPLRVQSVAWCVEMKDVLCGALCLACLILYANYRRQPSVRRYLAVAAAFTLALASKPMAVTIPAVMLLVDFWPLGGTARFPLELRSRYWRERAVEKLPLLAITAGVSVLTWFLQRSAGATGNLSIFPVALRLKNAPLAYCAYLGQTFWPTKLAVFYPHPGMIDQPILMSQWLPAVGVLALITISVIALARKCPCLLMGWCWYVGMLLPVIGLVQIGEHSRADRYTYLPSIGLTIALVFAADQLCRTMLARRHRATGAAMIAGVGGFAGVVAAALAVMTFVELGYWRDNQTLFTRANAVVPHNYLAESVLSAHMLLDDRVDEALVLGAAAVADSPHSAWTHHAYGVALLKAGRAKEAVHELKAAVRANYLESDIRGDLGRALLAEGRDDDALAQFKEAVRLSPDDSLAHHNLAAMYARQGHYDEAIAQWDVALRLSPNDGVVHGWLGEALRLRGDHRGAKAHLRFAIASGEHNPDWETDLAWYLATDPASTPADIEQAVSIAKDACDHPADRHAAPSPLALDALAAALARAGRFDDAVTTAQQAIVRATADNQPKLAAAIGERMAKYRAGQPTLSPEP
jgi:Flp pilus assembly protein TadD